MYRDGGLLGEHGLTRHLDEHNQVVTGLPDNVPPADQVVIQGVQKVPEGRLVLLKYLVQVREEGPDHRRDLSTLFDEAFDGEYDIVLKLDLDGVDHELKEWLQGLLQWC